MSPKSNDGCPYGTDAKGKCPCGGRGRDRARHLQAKESRQPPDAGRGRKDPPGPQKARRCCPLDGRLRASGAGEREFLPLSTSGLCCAVVAAPRALRTEPVTACENPSASPGLLGHQSTGTGVRGPCRGPPGGRGALTFMRNTFFPLRTALSSKENSFSRITERLSLSPV